MSKLPQVNLNFGGPGGMKPPPLSRRMFNKYDTDQSGTIDANEFRHLVYDLGYHLSDEEFAMAQKVLAKDGSGHIKYEEFANWWQQDDRFAKLQLKEEELEVMNKATSYFQKHDTSGNGTIEKDEFTGLHAELKAEGLTNLPIDKCLEDLDTDRNGVISFNEFVDWLIKKEAMKIQLPQKQ